MSSADEVARTVQPKGQILRLWRVPKLGNIVVRFASPFIGLLTHRPRAADIPCPGPDECPGATHRGKSRWKGYAAGFVASSVDRNKWLPGVIEVTPRFEAQFGLEGAVGEAWEMFRECGASGHVEVTGTLLHVGPVPEVPAIDWILPVLCKVYSVASLHLGVKNPFRSQIFVDEYDVPAIPSKPEPEPASEAQKAEMRAKLRELRASFGKEPGAK
jgi:hypothetical protein